MTRVSVVVPTHNRRTILAKGLEALARQRYPLDQTEVLVVADGCTDGTEQIALPAPLTGRVISQPSRGPAAARNTGARAAAGDLLVFVDDDVEAWPELVEAHVRAHRAAMAPTLVVGHLPPRLQGRRDLFAVALRGWWQAMFERMREDGHRFTYTDALTGNCSISASLFHAVGGFDECLTCHEDYELGYRVLRAGGRIAFAPDAGGWHDDRTDLRRALRRKREEGVADVALARKHPELAPALPFASERWGTSRRERQMRRLALRAWPAAGDPIAEIRRFTLGAFARIKARKRWRTTLDSLFWYWYWRGIRDALGSITVEDFRRSLGAAAGLPADLPEIDLRDGLAAAAQAIDRLAPAGVRLRYGNAHVGVIPPQPWAEPLAGRHLRHVLKTTLAGRLGDAIALTHALEFRTPSTPDLLPLAVSDPIPVANGEPG